MGMSSLAISSPFFFFFFDFEPERQEIGNCCVVQESNIAMKCMNISTAYLVLIRPFVKHF